jgi:hypothetical protein
LLAAAEQAVGSGCADAFQFEIVVHFDVVHGPQPPEGAFGNQDRARCRAAFEPGGEVDRFAPAIECRRPKFVKISAAQSTISGAMTTPRMSWVVSKWTGSMILAYPVVTHTH